MLLVFQEHLVIRDIHGTKPQNLGMKIFVYRNDRLEWIYICIKRVKCGIIYKETKVKEELHARDRCGS